MSERGPVMQNTLYYGDNLDILRRFIVSESVDLIYLDPPFKSNQNYNVLFREKNGSSMQWVLSRPNWSHELSGQGLVHEGEAIWNGP